MYLDELMYNSFRLESYEIFLLEVFNTDTRSHTSLSYLTDNESVKEILYYGDYLDDDYRSIELYVIKSGDISDVNSIEEVVYKLLSLNQTDDALVAVFDDSSKKWFLAYLFIDYVVSDNQLTSMKTRINNTIHYYGFDACDDLLENLAYDVISSSHLRRLFVVDRKTILVEELLDYFNKYSDSKAYVKILNVLNNYINDSLDKKYGVYKVLRDYEIESGQKVGDDLFYELYSTVYNQEKVSANHVLKLCQESLIEYLDRKSPLSRDDLTVYVKNAYNNRNNILKSINESVNNNGKRFTNTNLPLGIFYNIDSIYYLLEDIRVLDFSVNSGIVVVTMVKLLSQLKFVNMILLGYEDVEFERIRRSVIKRNIYGVSLNKESFLNLKYLLVLKDNPHFKRSDALNLYKEYPWIVDLLGKVDINKPKSKVLKDITEIYNRSNMFSKININFEAYFLKREGYSPLVWQLDFSEVFCENDGFDIIISDVEHVELRKFKDKKKFLKDYMLYDNKLDYEYYFIEKALELVNSDGLISLLLDTSVIGCGDYKFDKLVDNENIIRIRDDEITYRRKDLDNVVLKE